MLQKLRDSTPGVLALFVLFTIVNLLAHLGTAGLVGIVLLSPALLGLAFLHIAPALFERALLRWLPKQTIDVSSDKARPEWVTTNHFDIMQIGGLVLYLRRFYLSPFTWARKLFLHKICVSDNDRDPHDHQWGFTSVILKGKYIENVYYPNAPCNCREPTECDAFVDTLGPCEHRFERRHAPAGVILRNRAEHTHTVEIIRTVWSLVFVGKKTRVWGFWKMSPVLGGKDEWVQWDRYLGISKPFDPVDVAAPRAS